MNNSNKFKIKMGNHTRRHRNKNNNNRRSRRKRGGTLTLTQTIMRTKPKYLPKPNHLILRLRDPTAAPKAKKGKENAKAEVEASGEEVEPVTARELKVVKKEIRKTLNYGITSNRSIHNPQLGGAIFNTEFKSAGHALQYFINNSTHVFFKPSSIAARIVKLTLNDGINSPYTSYSAQTMTNPTVGDITEIIIKFVLIGTPVVTTFKGTEIVPSSNIRNEVNHNNLIACNSANSDEWAGKYDMATPYVVWSSEDSPDITGIDITNPRQGLVHNLGETENGLEATLIELLHEGRGREDADAGGIAAAEGVAVRKAAEGVRPAETRTWYEFINLLGGLPDHDYNARLKLHNIQRRLEPLNLTTGPIKLGVIAMTIAGGETLHSMEERQILTNPEKSSIGVTLLHQLIRSIVFSDGILHLDLHGNNLFIQKIPDTLEVGQGRPVENLYNYRVTLIDFGRTTHMSKESEPGERNYTPTDWVYPEIFSQSTWNDISQLCSKKPCHDDVRNLMEKLFEKLLDYLIYYLTHSPSETQWTRNTFYQILNMMIFIGGKELYREALKEAFITNMEEIEPEVPDDPDFAKDLAMLEASFELRESLIGQSMRLHRNINENVLTAIYNFSFPSLSDSDKAAWTDANFKPHYKAFRTAVAKELTNYHISCIYATTANKLTVDNKWKTVAPPSLKEYIEYFEEAIGQETTYHQMLAAAVAEAEAGAEAEAVAEAEAEVEEEHRFTGEAGGKGNSVFFSRSPSSRGGNYIITKKYKRKNKKTRNKKIVKEKINNIYCKIFLLSDTLEI